MKVKIELTEKQILEAVTAYLLAKGIVAKTGQLKASQQRDYFDNVIGQMFSIEVEGELLNPNAGPT